MGMQLPTDSVILKARPLGDYVGVSGVGMLGAAAADPVEQVIASWGTWLQAVDQDMVAARDAAMAAHVQMGGIRQSLGMPAIDPTPTAPEGQQAPTPGEGAWTQELEDAYTRIISIATVAHQYAQEALAGKRKAHWVVDQAGAGQLGLEQLPGDRVKIVPASTPGGGRSVTAIDIASGQVMGQTSGALLVVGGVLAAVAIVGGAYLITRQICEAIESKQQAVTQKNLTDKATELINSGKATPAEASAFVAAIGHATPATAAQSSATEKNSVTGNLVDFAKILVVGGIVVVSLGGIIYLIKTYGPAAKTRAAAGA